MQSESRVPEYWSVAREVAHAGRAYSIEPMPSREAEVSAGGRRSDDTVLWTAGPSTEVVGFENAAAFDVAQRAVTAGHCMCRAALAAT